MTLTRTTAAALAGVVGFAVIPDQPRMSPSPEALVSQQADPPEFAVSAADRASPPRHRHQRP